MSRKKYNVDSFFFKKISIINSYIAGFIAGDGCVSDGNKGKYNLTIISKDEKHLISMSNILKYDGSIRYKNDKTFCLMIHDQQILNDLNNNFNIKPRKTFTLNPPVFDNLVFSLSYIIGLIDSDGCLYSSKNNKINTLIIVGTFNICTFVKNIFDHIVPPKTKRTSHVLKDGSIYRYTTSGKRALEIIKILFSISTFRLNRKWDKFNYLNEQS